MRKERKKLLLLLILLLLSSPLLLLLLLLLGVPSVAGKNRFCWWQQPQPTFLSIAWGEPNLAQPMDNFTRTILLLETTPCFVYSLSQPGI